MSLVERLVALLPPSHNYSIERDDILESLREGGLHGKGDADSP